MVKAVWGELLSGLEIISMANPNDPMKLACRTCGLAMPAANVNLAKGTYFCPRCAKSFEFTTGELAAGGASPVAKVFELASDEDALRLTIRQGNHSQLRGKAIGVAVTMNACAVAFLLSGLMPGIQLPVLAVGAFVVIGLILAVFALVLAWGSFTLTIDRAECSATWSLARWKIARRIPTLGITHVVEHEVFSTQRRRWLAIRIKHPQSDIVFGGTLADEERLRVLAELRRFLHLPAATAPLASVG